MLSLYRYLVLSSAKDTLTQRSHIVMRAMMWLVRMGVLVFLYRVAYLHTQADGLPINLSSALWSIAGYFVLSSLYLRILYRDISDDIQQGSIELHLSKPYNYLLRMMCVRLGRGLPDLGLSLVVLILILSLLVGYPQVAMTVLWALKTTCVFLLGIPLSLLVYGMVGLSAAWIEDATPLFWIIDKSVMILGGSYVPIALFPHSVSWVAAHSPFGAMMFITHVFNQDFSERWVALVTTQIAWIAILVFLSWFMYRRLQRRLLIHGG